MQTSNLFRLKKLGYFNMNRQQQLSAGGHDMNEADSQLECLMLQKDALHISINFNQLLTRTYWIEVRHIAKLACLPAVATNIFSSSKSRQDSKNHLFFKTKQQEFIHPLILSPTHETKLTKIQKNRVCFPSCSSWPNELSNWPFNQSIKKKRKTNNPTNQTTDHRIKTKYRLFSGQTSFSFLPSISMDPMEWNGGRSQPLLH